MEQKPGNTRTRCGKKRKGLLSRIITNIAAAAFLTAGGGGIIAGGIYILCLTEYLEVGQLHDKDAQSKIKDQSYLATLTSDQYRELQNRAEKTHWGIRRTGHRLSL